MLRWKFLGRQVHHPVGKAAVATMLALGLAACVPISPLLYVAHRELRRRGRNGFWFDQQLVIGLESFKRSATVETAN